MDSSACFLDSAACCSLSCSATWACRSISLKLWLLTFWAPRPFFAPSLENQKQNPVNSYPGLFIAEEKPESYFLLHPWKQQVSQSPCIVTAYRPKRACNTVWKNIQELTHQWPSLRDQPHMLQTTTSNDPEHNFFGNNIQTA